MESDEVAAYARLDKILLSVRSYCHPDAPREYVAVSRSTLPCGDRSSPLVSELCRALELGAKASARLVVGGREVEIVVDSALGGRVAAFVRREPRVDLLTFSEVYAVLRSLEDTLGVRIGWGRPFPRGSC